MSVTITKVQWDALMSRVNNLETQIQEIPVLRERIDSLERRVQGQSGGGEPSEPSKRRGQDPPKGSKDDQFDPSDKGKDKALKLIKQTAISKRQIRQKKDPSKSSRKRPERIGRRSDCPHDCQLGTLTVSQ